MATEASSAHVLGLATIAALTAFVIVFVTGWGTDNGWSIVLVAFVVFVAITFVSGYVRGRS